MVKNLFSVLVAAAILSTTPVVFAQDEPVVEEVKPVGIFNIFEADNKWDQLRQNLLNPENVRAGVAANRAEKEAQESYGLCFYRFVEDPVVDFGASWNRPTSAALWLTTTVDDKLRALIENMPLIQSLNINIPQGVNVHFGPFYGYDFGNGLASQKEVLTLDNPDNNGIEYGLMVLAGGKF